MDDIKDRIEERQKAEEVLRKEWFVAMLASSEVDVVGEISGCIFELIETLKDLGLLVMIIKERHCVENPGASPVNN